METVWAVCEDYTQCSEHFSPQMTQSVVMNGGTMAIGLLDDIIYPSDLCLFQLDVCLFEWFVTRIASLPLFTTLGASAVLSVITAFLTRGFVLAAVCCC